MKLTILSLLLCFAACAQEPSAPGTKFTVEVRRVPVDVIVTDAKGKPVRDLKKEEFVVLEEKKPQEITSFTLERVSSTEDAQKSSSIPDGFLTNATIIDPSASDLTVILFDELNTRFSDAAYARSQLEKLLSRPSLKGHPLSLLVLNRELLRLHDFSSDPEKLLFAFKRHSPFMPVLDENEFSGLKINPYDFPSSVSRDTRLSERQYQEAFGRFNVISRAETTLSALRVVADSLRNRQGRKRIIWLSAGFPITFDEGALSRAAMNSYQRRPDSALLKEVQETSLALTNARVAVYPIDVRGLEGDSRIAANRSRLDESVAAFEDFGAMQTIAEQTGGQFIHDRNDLAESALRAVNDGSEYYALTYRPSDAKLNGTFRRIEVRVNRPGVRVRYRKGYFSPKDQKKETIQQSPFYAAATSPLQRTELQFAAAGIRTSESSARFMIILNPDALGTNPTEIGVAKKWDLVLVEELGPNKRFLGEPHRLELKIDPANAQKIAKDGFPFVINLRTKGKSNRVRLVLRDTATDRMGSLDIPLQKPTS